MPTKASPGQLEFTALMALLTSMIALSIDAILPALSFVGSELKVSNSQDLPLVVSIFFVGIGLGQLLFGPICDAFGRRTTVMLGMLVYILGSLVCLFAGTIEMLLLGRVVQAFGVAGPRVASLAMIRDKFAGEAMAKVMSFMMMIFILVPMVAPMIGQGILWVGSWRDIFAFFLLYAVLVSAWFFWRQDETLKPEHQRSLKPSAIWQASKFVVTHPQAMAYTVASGLIFGSFLGYLSNSQRLFQEIYLVGEAFSFYFAMLAFAIGLSSFINGKIVQRKGMLKMVHWALGGYLASGLLLAFLTWQAGGVPSFWQTLVLLFVAFLWVGILFGNLSAMAMGPLGEVAGIGAAITQSLSSLLSVPVSILIGHYFSDSLMPIAIGFLVTSLVSIALIETVRRRPY